MQEVPIAVAIRVRPLVGQEKLLHEEECISYVNGKPHLILGKNRGFKFDHVFKPDETQDEVYKSCVFQLVENCMDGYNATVFAYGQTGSGKTYTMGTGSNCALLDEEIGILPRAINDIFQIIEKRSKRALYRLKVSFIEIYKEEIKDLLEFQGDGKELHIREDEKGNTIVAGLREETVHSLDDVMSCLDSGASLRHTASTQMNEYSSRSHCIFTIAIERHPMLKEEIDNQANSSESVTTARFHFVDLAGSERSHRTGNQGERFRESISINGGLLALGNVISALSDPRRRQQHVPYRQSKLTRLLKDSLGGNSRTLMIACLSSCSSDFDENLNSLKYATRVKNIRNKPIINTVVEATKLAKMQNELQVLREELIRQKTVPVLSQGSEGPPVDIASSEKLKEEIERLKSTCDMYGSMSSDAASLIKLFYGSDMPPYDIQDKLAKWIERWESCKSFARELAAGADDARRQIIDQEMLMEKSQEIEEFKVKIQALENEKESLAAKLREISEGEKRRERQMFEQQLKIHTYEDEIGRLYHANDDKNTRNSSRMIPPKSAPSRLQKRRASTLSRFKTRYASFDDDQLMRSFRARNELLVSKYEDIDEVSHDDFDSSEEDESEAEGAGDRGLKSTFTKAHSSFPKFPQNLWNHSKESSANAQGVAAREELHFDVPRKGVNRPLASMTPSKLPVRRTPSNQNEVAEKTPQTSENTKRKLRNVELDLKDARQKLLNLQGNIKQKEELIKELIVSDREKQEVNNQYKEKLKHLEKETEQAKKDLEEARSKLESVEKEGSSKQKLEREYKKKLKAVEAKVSALESKRTEANLLDEFRNKGDRKIKDLEGHIERLRNHYDSMAKKLKQESEEKSKLEQDLTKGEHRIKELEIKTDQQSKILKRKTEEALTAQRKLRAGSNAHEQEVKDELDVKREKIDEEIDKIVKEKQKIEELDKDLKKREEIIRKKEDLLKEKYKLEMKKVRSSQILNQDIVRLSVQLDDVQKAISDAKRASIIAKDKARFQEDVNRLLRRKEELDQQRKDLELKLEGNEILEPTEERHLIELIEAVEALEMAIDFKNEIIENKENSFGIKPENEVVPGRLMEMVQELSAVEIKGLLHKYFERVIELKEAERKMMEMRDEIEIELTEKEKLAQELQHSLVQMEARAERKLTELEKDHEKEIQFLIEKVNNLVKGQSSNEVVRSLERKIQELERELFYYKKTSRELKHRLREVSGASIASESMPSEKHSSRMAAEKTQGGTQTSEERKANLSRVGSPEAQMGKHSSEENFYLPPVQQAAQEEKKSKNDQKDGRKSPKTHARSNYENYVNQDEQKRLKDIFESRQQTSKARKEYKHQRGDGSVDQKSASSSNLQSHYKDSNETGKNPWS